MPDVRGRGGASSFLRRPRAVRRRAADRLRVARWHLCAAVRSWRIRTESPRAHGTWSEPAPAFDLRGWNPIGWRRDADGGTAALGPLHLLPPGVEAERVVRRRARRRLRHLRHLEDVQAFHADAATRAGELVRLAAWGVVAHLADGGRRLRPLLGPELHGAMTADVAGIDAGARELLGIRMRRAALRDHSSWGRARRSGPREPPLVSILLATRRPRFLPWALDAVARQTYPRVELVLALHGEGFPDVERRVSGLPCPVKVLRAPAGDPLGAVLDAATGASQGTLLTKMDDDDVYGADHVWDLVLAREYSGAQLVGKYLEFVHLAAADRTMHWRNGDNERYWPAALAGGALLTSRRDLDRAGGWRKAPAGVDTALAEDVLRTGGRIYRTHAAGFMLVRHGCRHTWNDREGSDERLLARADRVWPGFQPHRAGIDAPDLPHPALNRAARRPAPREDRGGSP